MRVYCLLALLTRWVNSGLYERTNGTSFFWTRDLRLDFYQPLPTGRCNRFGATEDIQLGENVAEVRFHC
jgi:hypothetical protein